MSVASPSMNTAQEATNNPALNPAAFQKQMEKTGEKSRAGMTVRGAYIKTLLLIVLTFLAASFGWSQVEIVEIAGRTVATTPSWSWLLYIAVLIFGIGGILAGRAIPIFAIGYALSFGVLLGMASHFYNLEWDGIVLQAVLATLAVFTATLILYMTGVIKPTNKFIMGVSIAMGALFLLYMVTWLFSIFGVRFSFFFTPTPLGITFALLVVILAALNLPIDFAFIERAANAGAPKIMEWYGAYGLMLSIIWMFVSILRLLALLRMASR